MEAKNILDATLENYVRCNSYEDEGRVVEVSKTTASERVVKGAFSTIFIRPDLARFDLRCSTDPGRHSLILQADGDSTRAMYNIEKSTAESTTSTQAYPSLRDALLTYAGFTSGVTPTTFGLLSEIKMAYDIRNAKDIHRLPNETVSDIECYRLSAVIDPEVRYDADAWISIDTFCVVKYEKRTTMTEKTRDATRKLAEQFRKAEEIPDNGAEFICSTATIWYDRVVFNNSITIDKIISSQL